MKLSEKLKRMETRTFLPGTPPEYTKEAEVLEARIARLEAFRDTIRMAMLTFTPKEIPSHITRALQSLESE